MTNILRDFWVLEGLDGAGTTTQLKQICKVLEHKKLAHYMTFEPTDMETGKFLRKVLSGEIKAGQSTIAYLFAADRDNHLNNTENGIISHLNKKEIVVSDRYIFSSLAYQSIGFDYDVVQKLNSQFPFPEYVIFIDTPVNDCIKRIDDRHQNKEIYEKLDYQKQVKEAYEKCFKTLPQGCTLIRVDGSKPVEQVTQDILAKLNI